MNFPGNGPNPHQNDMSNQFYQQGVDIQQNNQYNYGQGYEQNQNISSQQPMGGNVHQHHQFPCSNQNNLEMQQSSTPRNYGLSKNSCFRSAKTLQSNITTEKKSVLKSNLYPSLPPLSQQHSYAHPTTWQEYKTDYSETGMFSQPPNKFFHEQVPGNESGWGQQKSINVSKGNTKFVEQIGFHENCHCHGRSQKKHHSHNKNKGQGSEIHENQNIQNFDIYSMLGNNMNKNIMNKMNYELNPIFSQLARICTFPSPFVKYKIIPYLDEKKALDVTSVNDSKRGLKKNSLIIWSYHGGPNQIFYIKGQINGNHIIINIAKGFVVKVPTNLKSDESPMEVGPMQGEANQKWLLTAVGNNYFNLVSAVTGKVLDLFHESSADGTPVIQWNSTGRKNQQWKIVPA